MKNNELIASIPYDNGKEINFYSDKLVYNNSEIFYEDITGIGYSLVRFTQSIYFIPVYSTQTATFLFELGPNSKPHVLTIGSTTPMLFQSERQKDIAIVYAEIIKILRSILFGQILENLEDRYNSGEALKIGALTLENGFVGTRGGRILREKEMDGYGGTYINAGTVTVKDFEGKIFISMPLQTINAPILAYLLNTIYET